MDQDGRPRFSSSTASPYLSKVRSVEELVPWFHLKGISAGDFGEALAALLGQDAKGLSDSTITFLKVSKEPAPQDEFEPPNVNILY